MSAFAVVFDGREITLEHFRKWYFSPLTDFRKDGRHCCLVGKER
jgi:hypothetical protein